MDAAANGVAEEQDDQRGIDQQDVLYRMVLFLATVTVRLFSRVLGADNAPFRPVMSKRGEPWPATGAEAGEGAGSSSGASAPSETASRCARAVRERAGASPRPRSAVSNAGSRTTGWLCSGSCRTAALGPLERCRSSGK